MKIELIHTVPYWPQANGECERQNRTILARLQIAQQLYGDYRTELDSFLQMYYSTPHSTTGKTPTELMYGNTIATKIPSAQDLEETPLSTEYRDRDQMMKMKGKELADRRRGASDSGLEPGDTVLMKNLHPKEKLDPPMNPEPFVVLSKEGPRVTIKSKVSGVTYDRSSAHLKKIPTSMEPPFNIDVQDCPKDIPEATPTHGDTNGKNPISATHRPTRNRRPPARFRDQDSV